MKTIDEFRKRLKSPSKIVVINPPSSLYESLLAFILLASIASAGANVSLTTSEWVQFALWKLEANGLTGPIFASSRPFEREEIARIVANMRRNIEDGRIKPRPHELELIRKLEKEFAGDLNPKGLRTRSLLAGEANYSNEEVPPLENLPLIPPLVKEKTVSPPFVKGGQGGFWASPSASIWAAASFHPIPDVALYEEVKIGKGKDIIGKEGKSASRRTNPWRWDYTADFRRAYIRLTTPSQPLKNSPLIERVEELARGDHPHPGLPPSRGKEYSIHKYKALLGRQSLFWGPGYGGSLIVSDNSPAFDMVLSEAVFGTVKAIAFSAMLDKMWSEHGDPPYRYLASRYLSGHRIDWLVNNRIELGLSELILYGGEARGMELQYVNPLLPYYASQWNSKQDDNVLVSADFAIRPIDRLKVYGQFLVDDFNYTDHDPNALGYLAGVYLSDLLSISGMDLRAEYTRIDTWTYTHLKTENQFTHYGWVIGHHLGPDADQIFIELSQMINVVPPFCKGGSGGIMDARIKLNYAFEREGSRTVADRFRGEDYKRMKFPSGSIERRHRIGLQFLWEPLRGPQMNLSYHRVFNEKHSNVNKNDLTITAGYLFDLCLSTKG